MTIYVNDIFLPVNHNVDDAFQIALKRSGVKKDNVKKLYVRKKSIDARGGELKFVYSVCIVLYEPISLAGISGVGELEEFDYKITPTKKLKERPVIVGFGPAGIFCAYLLALYGAKPIVFELGKNVDERKKDVDLFFQSGIFNKTTNVQFGEGGAGTFSDGKLTTRINDKRCSFVLKTFYEFGADESILYEAHPHIGTDKLAGIIKNIRKFIEKNGGEVYFQSEVTGFQIENKQMKGVILSNGEKISTDKVVLAVGHSSRKMYELLSEMGIAMEKKPFSVGLRIEHKREFINYGRYGKYAENENLGAADYQFSYRKGERGCYTFCMCPGGQVIASNSEEATVVTNGMSKSLRDDVNSNSAVVASVLPQDLDSNILSGVEYQRALEKKAFVLGGGTYSAPAQLSCDFLSDKKTSAFLSVKPSYPLGIEFCNFNDVLPDKIKEMLKLGLASFDKKIKGFSSDAGVLTGFETRTSAPLRVLRGSGYNSISLKGLYPCGEGAGYAGGITSAAVDGLRIAQAILEE